MRPVIAMCMLMGAVLILSTTSVSCDNGPGNSDGGNGGNDIARTYDFRMGSGATEPTCTPPGVLSCPSGSDLVASPTVSGCVPTGTTVSNPITPPYDNPSGTCASIGDVVVSCTHSPNCSSCMKPTAAVPPGCTFM